MIRFPAVVVLLLSMASPAAAAPQPAPLNQGQIDSLLAPIALYPDALLSKVLIASTFPDQVTAAEQWARANPNLKGAAFDRALATKNWDDNVKALARLPEVLDIMANQEEWMHDLGGAFIQQQADVMVSIQRLRRLAKTHGSLHNTTQQRVAETGDTIVIETTQPTVAYVPYYSPTTVYGTWAHPAYAPYYWPAPAGYAFANGLAWGAGVAISAAFWSNAFNWHSGTVWYGGGWYHNSSWNRGYYHNWNAHYHGGFGYHGGFHGGAYHGGGYHGGFHGGTHNNGGIHRGGGRNPGGLNNRGRLNNRGALNNRGGSAGRSFNRGGANRSAMAGGRTGSGFNGGTRGQRGGMRGGRAGGGRIHR